MRTRIQVTDDRLPEDLNTGAPLPVSNPTMARTSPSRYRHKPSRVVTIGSYCLPTVTSHYRPIAVVSQHAQTRDKDEYEQLERALGGFRRERCQETQQLSPS